MEAIGFERHNHHSCIVDGVSAARAHCEAAGLQLTPIRERVLEILLQEHRALGAYDILDRLREEGQRSQPPVAYRALDFLVKHGFVHKIERLNSFVACVCPNKQHAPAFLICTECGKVAEAISGKLRNSLLDTSQSAGFAIERTVVEAEGICPNCQKESTG